MFTDNFYTKQTLTERINNKLAHMYKKYVTKKCLIENIHLKSENQNLKFSLPHICIYIYI